MGGDGVVRESRSRFLHDCCCLLVAYIIQLVFLTFRKFVMSGSFSKDYQEIVSYE